MASLLDIIHSPWACEPAVHAQVIDIYMRHARGELADLAAIQAQLGRPLARKEQGYELRNGVAVISVEGVIVKRMNMLTNVSGGASTELVGRDIESAVADPAAKAILLQIDSPGGAVEGVQELARVVRGAAAKKPVTAVADSKMLSAAYWIGSAASEIYATSETTMVGSIGVVMKHLDVSKGEERIGIKTTEIFAGKYKRIASEHEPLSDEGRATLQGMVDYIYSVFVDDVARYRGVSASEVLNSMGDGRVFMGSQARAAGLIDGLATVDELVAHLASGTRPNRLAARPAAAVMAEQSSRAAAHRAPGETLEQSCTRRWRESADVRAEFGVFEGFLGWERALERQGSPQ